MTDLPQKIVDAALHKLNAHIANHNRAVYSAQTQRHVAEQIDALYWSDVTQLGRYPLGRDEMVMGKDIDISTPEGLDALPGVYDDLFLNPGQQQQQQHTGIAGQEEGGGGGEEEEEAASRYALLRVRLGIAMAEQRKQRSRLEGYRRLAKLLEPFESPGEETQPNLMGASGELGRELDKMRILLARVTGRIGELGRREVAEGEDEGMIGERKNLRDVMDAL